MVESKNQIEITRINLEIDSSWSLNDFQVFFKSINNIYNTLFAIKEITIEQEYILNNYEKIGPIHPFFDEFLFHYKRMKKLKEQKELIPLQYYVPFGNQSYLNEYINQILSAEWYINPKFQINIKKIKFASKGLISIEAGSVIREIRELVKDIFYRNSQEKRSGELDIFQKQIDVMEQIGFPKHQIGRIISKMNSDSLPIQNLIKSGQLRIPSESNQISEIDDENRVIVRGMKKEWFIDHFKDMKIYFGGSPVAIPKYDSKYIGFYLESPDSAITHIGIVKKIERDDESVTFFLKAIIKLENPIKIDDHAIRKQEYWTLEQIGIKMIDLNLDEQN